MSASSCACVSWATPPRRPSPCPSSSTRVARPSTRCSQSRCAREQPPLLLPDASPLLPPLLSQRARATLAAKEGVLSGGTGLLQLSAPVASAAAGGAGGPADPCAVAAVDDALSIRLLKPNRGVGGDDGLDDESADAARAAAAAVADSFSERLKRIHQLTGFADPVYCEAFVRVHEYDIVLELTLLNRTDATMTNVTVELSTMGDLKLVERPAAFTLAPKDSRTLRANIKVSSTETGHIFGTIVYDTPGAANVVSVVNLAEIHVDILDYVHPATCSDSAFRSMWADFEWENKVSVNTNITNLGVRCGGDGAGPGRARSHPPSSSPAGLCPAHRAHDEHAHPDAHRAARGLKLPRRQPLRALHLQRGRARQRVHR